MRIYGNTILITGGATGIGLALAKSLLELGNEVIICGRRTDRLSAARQANPALHVRVADVSDPEGRNNLVAWLGENFPRLNILVNNAGVQHLFGFRDGPSGLAGIDEEIATNLSAPIHLTTLLLPLLEGQSEAAILNISSGLGFTPLAQMPVYCATKAALHSLTMSLRYQLRATAVRVFEIIPPLVQSELGAAHRPAEMNSSAMPADVAVSDIIAALSSDTLEVAIGDAANLFNKRDALFPMLNRG
jgi:uncharacterized oxidoreductase